MLKPGQVNAPNTDICDVIVVGLENTFEQVHFPSGKVSVDGFICVVDVSRSQPRPMESQLDFVAKILSALSKTKKPVVVAVSKMDEGSDAILQVRVYC